MIPEPIWWIFAFVFVVMLFAVGLRLAKRNKRKRPSGDGGYDDTTDGGSGDCGGGDGGD